uniref:Uncharacterized protein n=1 Tax=Magallana gigas TaxID=29159 RepID=K1QR63_MAGGI
MFDAPKQFMVANETYSDEIWQDECDHYDDTTRDSIQSEHNKLKFQREATMEAGLEDFDLDFMMPKNNFSLPRLALGETETPGEHSAECECCHDVNVRREKRHQRPKPWSESHPVNEMITENVVETPVVDQDAEESFEFCLTEAEKVKWLSEQQFEKALVGSNFEPPRLVGGPGYLYILRKFAVTPQKLKKESYKCVRE